MITYQKEILKGKISISKTLKRLLTLIYIHSDALNLGLILSFQNMFLVSDITYQLGKFSQDYDIIKKVSSIILFIYQIGKHEATEETVSIASSSSQS